MIEGRGANDIIDGDRYLDVRISVRTDPANPATEIGTTDLMEHAALSGTWVRQPPGMTLQQAVFAGLVDPGQPRDRPRDPDRRRAAGRLDIAQFSGPAAEYEITENGDGSVTVDHQAGAGADGIDTLWNIETLRFCNAVDANGVCTAPVIGRPSGGVAGTPALSVTPTGTPAAHAPFGTVAVGAAPAARSITVTNTGGGTLNVTAATLAGANANQFSILNNGCAGTPLGARRLVRHPGRLLADAGHACTTKVALAEHHHVRQARPASR